MRAQPLAATSAHDLLWITKANMTANHVKRLTAALMALPAIGNAQESMSIGFQTPQTIVARQIYDLHTLVLWICIVIALVVFGIMFYSIVRHRRSIGHQAKQFDQNRPLEILWTVIPCFIVAGVA